MSGIEADLIPAPPAGDLPAWGRYPEVARPARLLNSYRTRCICRKAGVAAACWYRMVPDNVRTYRFVRDYPNTA